MSVSNAERQRRYRERKKAQAAAALDGSGVVDVATPEADLSIEVKANPVEKPKLGLRERLGLGKKVATPEPVKRGRKPTAAKPNLVVTVLPTLVASLVAAWAKDRIPEEYKPCAPTREEVSSVLGPLMDIIGRRVEVAAQVSQDVIDVTNALICTMAYGVRAYVTYVDIKKAKEAGITYEEKQRQRATEYRERLEREAIGYDEVTSSGEPSLAGGLRGYQATHSGTDQHPVGGNGARPDSEVVRASSNGASNPDDDQQLRDSEAELIAQMFKRDKFGRTQLGLLPRGV